jgi:hypothetical protein
MIGFAGFFLFFQARVILAEFRSDGIQIFCKACSENVTLSDHLINIKSDERVGIRNETFAYERGVIIQEFINPAGFHFDLITVTRADVLAMGKREKENSFFEGFDWTIVVCPKCKNHIGWAFTPLTSPPGSDPTFYALIHEKLYYELDGRSYVNKSWNS